jgi:alpha-D-ribose 1-methylphosphonate 5-phosphate C-P lyase
MVDPLRWVEPNLERATVMHGEADYGRMWVYMYESVIKAGDIRIATQYPVIVAGRYMMDTTPIPRWDVLRLHNADHLSLFGAGREKRVYAVPPYTTVEPLEFEDFRFKTEYAEGQRCHRCGATNTFLTGHFVKSTGNDEPGHWVTSCSDASYCDKQMVAQGWTEAQE